MKFEIKNAYKKQVPLSFEISHKGEVVEFSMLSILNKRKIEVIETHDFNILEGYINHKGELFADKLMALYITAYDTIADLDTDMLPLPVKIVHDIIDLFDEDDFRNYITDIYRISVLPLFKLKFNNEIIQNKEGSREQTYIRDDYIDLVVFAQIVKASMGPIGEFGTVHSSELARDGGFVLSNFIRSHPIANGAVYRKLYDSTVLTVNKVLSEEDKTNKVFSISIKKENLADYILASVLFKVIGMANVDNDTTGSHLVSKIFKKTMNKLNSDKVNSLTERKLSESADDDSKGIMEIFSITSEVTNGDMVVMESMLKYISNNYDDIDLSEVDTVEKRLIECDIIPTDVHVKIVGLMFKKVIDPRSLLYVRLPYMLRAMAVGYVLYRDTEFDKIARILISRKSKVLGVSSSSKTRIDTKLLTELDRYYPYHRVVSDGRTDNDIVTLISDIFDMFFDTVYIQCIETDGGTSKLMISDFKNLLSRFIISIEKEEDEL